jgi:hypothetical protein
VGNCSKDEGVTRGMGIRGKVIGLGSRVAVQRLVLDAATISEPTHLAPVIRAVVRGQPASGAYHCLCLTADQSDRLSKDSAICGPKR